MKNILAVFLALIFLAGGALSQAKKKTTESSAKVKSVHVQIDGFMKSKSGAV
jgi:hypothetical protein